MKFLLDENIPIEAAQGLNKLGHDVKTAIELNLKGKSDNLIFETVKKLNRVLITLDLDFSNILNYPPKSHPGIIIVRVNNPSRKKIVEALVQFIKNIKPEEILHSLVILEDREYRIRK